jgi:hypothetical protein
LRPTVPLWSAKRHARTARRSPAGAHSHRRRRAALAGSVAHLPWSARTAHRADRVSRTIAVHRRGRRPAGPRCGRTRPGRHRWRAASGCCRVRSDRCGGPAPPVAPRRNRSAIGRPPHHRQRQRKAVIADLQHRAIRRGADDLRLLGVPREEAVARTLTDSGGSVAHQRHVGAADHTLQLALVACLQRSDERREPVLGRAKGLRWDGARCLGLRLGSLRRGISRLGRLLDRGRQVKQHGDGAQGRQLGHNRHPHRLPPPPPQPRPPPHAGHIRGFTARFPRHGAGSRPRPRSTSGRSESLPRGACAPSHWPPRYRLDGCGGLLDRGGLVDGGLVDGC